MPGNQYGRPPYHEDFDVLSEAVVQADALSGSGVQSVLDLVGAVADPETAAYFAARRGEMVAVSIGAQGDLRATAAMGGAWLDGLLAGYRLRQAHERRSDG